ncbi:regulator of chromosome condensation 1/beta-lactamase-inhibitor protein II [Chaetomium sp. MPI-CAGE-AT-0009]|nr:regulator of chromosome condensation 1/beta-lactamase-inhibitor protein II [Chaetomium sp. MPI-CAGE-AT-0009]
MAPRKPTATTRGHNGASSKRTRERDAAVPEGRPKRQKTSAATESLIQAQIASPAPRVSHRSQTAAGQRATSALPILSQRPTRPLTVYVFGANSGGELGLGPSVKSGNIGVPRVNSYLSESGVVQISLGAMHGVALTLDNKILTWGVNDHGALGRDTTWEENLVDADGDDSDSDDGADLNPRECTPTPIDMGAVPPDTVFTQVAATDNATFALTSTGRVYGWGTFRSEDGKLSFTPTVQVQTRPALILSVKDIIKLCCGSNHVLALTADGLVYTWGKGTDGQLGRRFSSRVVDWGKVGLIPRKVAELKDIVDIGSGSNHSFAIERTGQVYGWGFNNAGQVGALDKAGNDESAHQHTLVISVPTLAKGLVGLPRIKQITGGNFHTIAATEDGKCLTWGRLYSYATGLKIDALPPQSVVRDSRGPSFLGIPTTIPGLPAAFVAAASEHSLAVTTDQNIYTWGLNLTKQIAQKGEEIEVATRVAHPSVADLRIVWAGAGAQYSMIAEFAVPE